MRGHAVSAPGVATGSPRLDDLLAEAVTGTGAHIGAAYLLAEDGKVLLMDTALGLPATMARALARIRTNDPVPIAAAVRERRLVWLSCREHLARAFPVAALVMPYHFAVAAVPIRCGGAVRGGFLLLWPAGHMARLNPRKLAVIENVCAQAGDLLARADGEGRPVVPATRPRILDPRAARPVDPRADLVALDCLNRLPEGFCVLDGDGRMTLVTAPAADLLRCCPADLVGARPWERLPWLGDPAFEDRYRAAVVGHQVTAFTARNPAGRRLSFQLYPGLSGVTVRVAPEADPGDHGQRAPEAGAGRRSRVLAIHEMLHLATTLARAVSAQEVIDLVADHVMPVYDVQALAILTAQGGRARVAAARGYSRQAVEEFDGRPVIPQAPGGQPFDHGGPDFFGTWEELRRAHPDAVRSDGMSAWAFLPLVTSHRAAIGTCVLAHDRPHRFTTDERATLTALAGLIAQAFERARLYDVTHQLAECLQSSLLPRTLPEVPGLELAARYMPATPGMDIGGDFYDLIRLNESMVAAVIGDVQGHDMTAAALMGQVRTAIRAHATAGATPGDVLAHTNRLLTELAPDRFTSCLYLSLDLRAHTACLASAGHLPPLIARPDAPARVVHSAPGLLLGIDPGAEYATTELALPPGAVLVLYTDGLVEEPGGDLGEAIEKLAELCSPRPGRPLVDLLDCLIEPASVEQRADDIAVLLLREATS
ncbi:SpoIIE family protein phosphatase [Nonomuraea jiangxiensis]|uniref:protein-serine/threonine phosphatase n=1 Tax=Nonomuraea jiangxiensis TaxID=633440 RepID=A0A1G8DPQ7_9ACTN|nr:SpoIIE family protein phosphatase [Nonomuraea jiangxiensis]SDH59617.1 Serine phosphatase RsbU, regulator of sigma subunit [Nonomuraea jiangxiensis]